MAKKDKKEISKLKLDKQQMGHYLNSIEKDNDDFDNGDIFIVVRQIEDYNLQEGNVQIENLSELYWFLINNIKRSA
ncbi:MAG: hypothetical protein J7L15_08750 [Clostridiales bacterium]|nr:hypothetical protein [Clostridiales bacterium]